MATHSGILPGKSHGQKSLVGYSPQGCKASDMTEQSTHLKIRDKRSIREDTLQDSIREKQACEFGGTDSWTPSSVIRLFSFSVVHKYACVGQTCSITECGKFAELWKLITIITKTFYNISLFMFILGWIFFH